MVRSRKRNLLVEEDLEDQATPIYPTTSNTFYKLFDGAMLIDVGQLMAIVLEKEPNFERFTTQLFLECSQGINFQKAIIDPDSVVAYFSYLDNDARVERSCHVTWIKSCVDYCAHFDNMKFLTQTENQLAQLKKKVVTNAIIPGLNFSVPRIMNFEKEFIFQNEITPEPVDLKKIAARFSHTSSDGTRFIRSFTVHIMQNVFPSELHPLLSGSKSAKYTPVGDEIHSRIEELLRIALGKVPSLEVDTHISTNVKDSSIRFFENSRKRKVKAAGDLQNNGEQYQQMLMSSEFLGTGLTLSQAINGYQDTESTNMEPKFGDGYATPQQIPIYPVPQDSDVKMGEPENGCEGPSQSTDPPNYPMVEPKAEVFEEDTKYGVADKSYQ